MPVAYLLDANVFIEASRRYYGFDIVPAFWAWLERKKDEEAIASVLPVLEELSIGNDDLAEWARARVHGDWSIDVSDAATQEAFAEIIAWVMAQDFTQAAKEKFLDEADPWLIAKARVLGVSIVTHEGFDLNRKNKVTIPVVCQHFNIEWLNTFDLIRVFGDAL